MDIYLSETQNRSADFTFPALPERITVKSGSRYHTYEMIGIGTVKIPKGTESKTISWNGIFYGKSKRNEIMIREWSSPSNCKRTLNAWMESGAVLRLLVTGTNINYDVTISNFECDEYGAYGNVEYTISFTTNRDLKVYTTSELGIGIASAEKNTVARPEPEASKTYMIVSGDNLWKIARKFYGGTGADWKKIYDANVNVIESAAKKHGKKSSDNGHWIYPGTEISIP